MRIRAILALVSTLMMAAGCSGGDDATSAAAVQDAQNTTVTTPDATAADNAKALAAADMDPEVKKVLGAAGN